MRPLCLLIPPRVLAERDGRPWADGRLQLLAGPERIESGGWDGKDVRRDYFVALDARQYWLWIYRTCGVPAQWFLPGLFA